MSVNAPQKRPTVWSSEMLKEFHKFINSLLPISFSILEKHKSTTFSGKNSSTTYVSGKTSHVSYRGVIPVSGFENISVIFNPVKSIAGEYRDYIGYIEIANGSKEDSNPGPEIRGVFQEKLGIDEIFNEMLTESKMFNAKMSPIYIYLEQSYCLKDKSPEELLKKKIPIREISTFQKISCNE
jgi:hypothetical protein